MPPPSDSLLAKLIVHGRDRAEALDRLDGALSRCEIQGITTNIPMHRAVLGQAGFAQGGVDTAWFTRFLRDRPVTASIEAPGGGHG